MSPHVQAGHDLEAAAERVASWARSGEEVEVYVARALETDVRAYAGEVESLTSATSAGVGVRVVADHRQGFAWAGSLEEAVLAETLAAARDNAGFAVPDEHLALAVPDGVPPVAVDLFDPSLAQVPTADKVALALDLEARARGAHPAVRQVSSADYGDVVVETALVSTTGVRATGRRTSAYASVSVIAGDGDASQTGTGFTVGRSYDVLDPEAAAVEAVERAVRMLGAAKGGSGRMTVVFDRRVTSTLLGALAAALSGEAAAKGRSFFADRLGEQVAEASVTLVDDPTDVRAYGAAVYDGEGLACRRNVLVDGGVLREFLYDTVTARRVGARPNGAAVRGGYAGLPGPGCRALVLSGGSEDLDEPGVLATVGEGLYVQSVTGVHSGVSPVSGDVSVGAEGLRIRDGHLAEPVREVTVASTFQRMLRSMVAVGADLAFLPGVAAGQTVAVADMQVSGT